MDCLRDRLMGHPMDHVRVLNLVYQMANLMVAMKDIYLDYLMERMMA